MLALKSSLAVLDALSKGRRPHGSSATLWRCYAELKKHGLIEKEGRKYMPTKRGKEILGLLNGDLPEGRRK